MRIFYVLFSHITLVKALALADDFGYIYKLRWIEIWENFVVLLDVDDLPLISPYYGHHIPNCWKSKKEKRNTLIFKGPVGQGYWMPSIIQKAWGIIAITIFLEPSTPTNLCTRGRPKIYYKYIFTPPGKRYASFVHELYNKQNSNST